MNEFEPGEGWRRLKHDEVLEDGAEVINYSNGNGIRAWIREEPVPPLPTEPHTRIREDHGEVWTLMEDGYWERSGVERIVLKGAALGLRIAGFEVLAEPPHVTLAGPRYAAREERQRRETAKAVLDRVRDAVPHAGAEQMEPRLDAIAYEFAVEL